MATPRMLVLDLDGTALTGRNELRQDDLEAAIELKRRGVHVTIATGRLLAGTSWVAEALEVEGSVAVMNGSSRVDVGRSHVVHADAFEEAHQRSIAAIFDRHGLPGFLFGLDHIHVHQDDHDRYGDYLRIWTPKLLEHQGEAWHHARGTLAIGGVGSVGRIDTVTEELEALLPDLRAKRFDTFTGERFVEFRASQQDKGTALAAMAEERGLTTQDVVAVGDWWNDLPMLKAAGRSFAMGGATPEVQAVADETLDARAREGGAIAEIARRVWDVR